MSTPKPDRRNAVTYSKAKRYWPVLAYLCLLIGAVPWYWPAENLSLVFGVPGWVATAIGVSFIASVLTAYLLRTPWPGEEGDCGNDVSG